MKKPARKKKSNKKQIALVEELPSDIYSVRLVLQSLGFEVQSFASYEAGEFFLSKFSPKLIMVDMMISGGDAYCVIREIQWGKLKRIPVLAITADAMDGKEEDVYEAGAHDILSKPYSFN